MIFIDHLFNIEKTISNKKHKTPKITNFLQWSLFLLPE